MLNLVNGIGPLFLRRLFQAAAGPGDNNEDKRLTHRSTIMFRSFKKVTAAALIMSMVMGSAAYADVIYAPGSEGETAAVQQAAGPGGPGGAPAVTVLPEGVSEGTVVVGGGSYVPQETVAAAEATDAVTVEGPGGSAGTEAVLPQDNSQSVPADLVPVSDGGQTQSAQPVTGDGTVQVDPIIGYAPFVNAVMVLPSGIRTDGFTSNMDIFQSPEEGFTGLWARLEYGIGDCFYRVFTNEHGWSKWAMNEMYTPSTGDGAKVRAVQMRIKGHTRNLYDLYYRAVLDDGTVLDWAHDGQAAGAIGSDRYIKGFQMTMWRHGMAFNQGTSRHLLTTGSYEGVQRGSDGQMYYSTWNGQPFTGWAYDTDNNKYYFQDSHIVTGWQYIDGYKYYFDNSGRVVTDLEPIMGLPGDYIIKVNKDMKCMTVYAKDGDNGYIIPFKVFLVTIGSATPTGTFKTYEPHRWKFMHDDIYVQFLLRYKAGGFCIHSIIYQGAPDSYHLTASTYNQLGKNQSDGCIRLLSGDAAWIYNNCGAGTQVTIYDDEWVMGPFDRPAIEKGIPNDQNYDPTDPVIVSSRGAEATASQEAGAAAAQEAASGSADLIAVDISAPN